MGGRGCPRDRNAQVGYWSGPQPILSARGEPSYELHDGMRRGTVTYGFLGTVPVAIVRDPAGGVHDLLVVNRP